MKAAKRTPPPNAQRIYRLADLPKDRRPARFRITRHDGKTVSMILHKRRRQILELLMRGPVFCASTVRISDVVFVLKTKNGVDVKTECFPGDDMAGAGRFGVYYLHSSVARIDGVEGLK